MSYLKDTFQPKIIFSWGVKFLFKLTYFLGWSVLMAEFIAKLGIEKLPILIIAQAILVIVGMILFSFFINFHHLSGLIKIYTFCTAFLFVLAGQAHSHQTIYFSILLIAFGIFLPQLFIYVSSYIEEFYSPEESEKHLPLLESSETIAGISSGLILSLFSGYFSEYKITMLCALILVLTAVIFASYDLEKNNVHHESDSHLKKMINFKAVKVAWDEIEKYNFLQTLFVVLFIQWVIGWMLEFRYTMVVEESLVGQQLAAHQQGIIHGLGLLQLFMYSSALIMEFFIGKKIIASLGTFGSFLVHSIVTALSVGNLFLSAPYIASILARNNFEMTSILHRTAYESTFFAFREKVRKGLRELFEALLMPIALIFANIVILVVQAFFIEQHTILVLDLFSLMCVGLMSYFAYLLRDPYTNLVADLLKSKNVNEKMNAIEILIQNGHRDGIKKLLSSMSKKHEDEVIIKFLNDIKSKKILDARNLVEKFKKHHSQKVRSLAFETLRFL